MAQSTEHAPEGPLPAVHDEAKDTPNWLPITGLVLFVLMLLSMLYRAAQPDEVPVDDAAEAAPAEAAPEAAPAAE